MKKIRKLLKNIFNPPELNEGTIAYTFGAFIPNNDVDKQLKANEVQILRASLGLQKEAQQKTLYLMYASFMVSLLAFIVATAALIVAIMND